VTTVAWLAVTFLTPPSDFATLQGFFRRVHPGGPGWAPVARTLPEVRPDTGLGRLTVDWLAGVVVVYCTLFAVGKLLFATYTEGLLYLAAAVAAGAVIMRHLSRRGFGTLVE
jgi:solute:Na+ symporter, SSS family